jgi:hypothetical protein
MALVAAKEMSESDPIVKAVASVKDCAVKDCKWTKEARSPYCKKHRYYLYRKLPEELRRK